ncbi:MAG: hypothetical protein MIO93_15010 [ANME-2 cluster archaeon]|nr:hypothetical protein [ANME-2 cluster archaeon]
MKVTLSKNGEKITSIEFKAHEPWSGRTVHSAIECLEIPLLQHNIHNIDAVKDAFISQEKRPDNKPNIKYIADVNDDVWTIDVETPLCRACGKIEVDNEGDLCRECR